MSPGRSPLGLIESGASLLLVFDDRDDINAVQLDLNGIVSIVKTLPSTFHEALCSRLVQFGVHATSGCVKSFEPSTRYVPQYAYMVLKKSNPFLIGWSAGSLF